MKLKFRFTATYHLHCKECTYYVPSLYPDNNPGDCILASMDKNSALIKRYPGNCYAHKIIKRL